MSAKKHRLTLEFGAKSLAQIELVRSRTTLSSKTAVIQHALALFDLATEHQSQGGKIVFRDKDGKNETINILV